MKTKLTVVLAVISLLSLTACGKGVSAEDKAYLDLINQIEVGDTLDEINEIIGSEGEVHSDNATYSWEFERGGFSAVVKPDEEEVLRAISVSVSYENEDVANKKVVIKDLEDLKKKVGNGISYDDFKELLGGVDGVLVGKNSVTNSYVWRRPDGANVSASFTVEDNICNSFVGVEK